MLDRLGVCFYHAENELLKTYLVKRIIPKLLVQRCIGSIPRSGKEAESVNCYSIYLSKDNLPVFLLDGFRENKFFGKKWRGRRFQDECEVDLPEFNDYELNIKHYYGVYDFHYNSLFNFIFKNYLKFYLLQILYYKVYNSISQFFFNNKKLVSKTRMELLQFLIDITLESGNKEFSLAYIMTELYSIRWYTHPTGDDQEYKLEFYLKSLVSSGELEYRNGNFSLTGNALSTIEKYEEEERRHKSIVNLQKILVFLTVIIILVGLIQANIIKLKTLLDYS